MAYNQPNNASTGTRDRGRPKVIKILTVLCVISGLSMPLFPVITSHLSPFSYASSSICWILYLSAGLICFIGAYGLYKGKHWGRKGAKFVAVINSLFPLIGWTIQIIMLRYLSKYKDEIEAYVVQDWVDSSLGATDQIQSSNGQRSPGPELDPAQTSAQQLSEKSRSQSPSTNQPQNLTQVAKERSTQEDTPIEKLEKLNEMKEKELITEEEYQKKKDEILDNH